MKCKITDENEETIHCIVIIIHLKTFVLFLFLFLFVVFLLSFFLRFVRSLKTCCEFVLKLLSDTLRAKGSCRVTLFACVRILIRPPAKKAAKKLLLGYDTSVTSKKFSTNGRQISNKNDS